MDGPTVIALCAVIATFVTSFVATFFAYRQSKESKRHHTQKELWLGFMDAAGVFCNTVSYEKFNNIYLAAAATYNGGQEKEWDNLHILINEEIIALQASAFRLRTTVTALTQKSDLSFQKQLSALTERAKGIYALLRAFLQTYSHTVYADIVSQCAQFETEMTALSHYLDQKIIYYKDLLYTKAEA